MSPREGESSGVAKGGALFAVAAYLAWGIVAVYWRALGAVPAVEILAHRVIWSALFVAILLTAMRLWPEVRAVFRDVSRLRYLLGSTALISVNWGLFIWAVQSGHLLDASLGYYVNPLMNVALGVALLGERLRRPQVIAVALAAVGVVVLTIGKGVFPWIALLLSTTFAAYGLLRKLAPASAVVGLFVETSLSFPFALAFVIHREIAGRGALSHGTPGYDALLASCGIITALPLIWFAAATKRMPLSTLGFFQYISPTCQLLVAVFVFGEKLSAASIVTFALIWSALGLVTWDGLQLARARRAAERAASAT